MTNQNTNQTKKQGNRNYVNFSGNLVKDPELKYGSKGTAYTDATLANNEANGEVNYIPLRFFGKLAEQVAEHLRKGSFVDLKGNFEVRTSAQGNEYKTYFKVRVYEITDIINRTTYKSGGKSGGTSNSNSNRQANAPAQQKPAKQQTPVQQDEWDGHFDGAEDEEADFPF